MQDCIQKNNFNEAKCQKQVRTMIGNIRISQGFKLTLCSQIDALYECCNLFYQKNGDEASTVSCPKANLLRYVSMVSSLFLSHENQS